MFKKTFSLRRERIEVNEEAENVDEDNFSIESDLFRRSGEPVRALVPNPLISSRAHFNVSRLLGSSETQSEASSEPLEAFSDSHPLGLNVVYSPPNDQVVDIIFVHGLNGGSRRTWMKGDDPKTFWPLEFLPQEPQLQNARILTFGYNSDFGKGKSNATILDFAKQLLFAMRYRVDHRAPPLDSNKEQAPIIFIAHSMGGLVVKKAYSLGRTDPEFQDISRAVRAMVFLSTPHRGSNFAETLNRILRVSSITSPRKFVDDMRTNSSTLVMLNDEFRHYAENLDIVSFYETRPSNIGNSSSVVVERDSSVLSYPNEVSAPLDADHANICKFSSSMDPSYIAVRNTLLHLIAKVGNHSAKGLAKVKETELIPFGGLEIEAKKANVFPWAPDSPKKDLVRFRMQRTAGTCEWILNHPSYSEWVFRSQHLLWIYGHAASGKSTLASFVVDHLVESGICCQYFFFDHTNEKKKSIGVALRSLAHQLADTCDEYAHQLRQLGDAASDLEAADYRTVWQNLFEQKLFNIKLKNPLYWVIDGLDEAEDPGGFVRLLSESLTARSPMRVMVLSRQVRTISSAFQRLGARSSFYADKFRMEGNSDDLRRYINETLDIPCDKEFIVEISSQLLALCQGNFSWIRSTCQKINQCHTKVDVQNALEKMDADMEPLYDQMATSLNEKTTAANRGLVSEFLDWICSSQRQLTIEELHAALGDRGLLDLGASIVQLCSGFAVVTPDGQIDLVHRTARQYLMRKTSQVGTPIVDRDTANGKICLRCLECLSEPKLRLLNHRIRGSDFLDYAANFWFKHFDQVVSINHEILNAVAAFLSGPTVLIWISILARKKQLTSMVEASRCLTNVTSRFSKRYSASKIPSEIFSRVSVLACWAKDLVQVLGKFGRMMTQRPESIHKLIPPLCPESSLIFYLLGEKEVRPLRVSGMRKKTWGECLSSMPLDKGLIAKSVHALDGSIVIQVDEGYSTHIYVYNPATFELEMTTSKESVLLFEVDRMSGRALAYGSSTTTLWDVYAGYPDRFFSGTEFYNRWSEASPLALSISGDVAMLCFEDLSIYSANMADRYPSWELTLQLHDHLTLNSSKTTPSCSSFSPDGAMVAFGCRGHSVIVWDLVAGDFVGRCNFIRGDIDSATEGTQQGDMIQLAWHPSSMTILGLRGDGILFKWDIYEEEPSRHMQTDARAFRYNPDGSMIVTTGELGTIKIFRATDFRLIHQISAQSPGVDIAFSSDSRMLYDLREGHTDVHLTSTVLDRLVDSPLNLDNSAASLGELRIHHTYRDSRCGQSAAIWIPIISAQAKGSLYCHNTESGMIILSEVGVGRVCGVEKRAKDVRIEQILWSNDDSLLAIIDSSGRLTVKKVIRDDSPNSPRSEHLLEITLPTTHGPCLQALFLPDNDRLFIAFSATIIVVDIASKSFSEHLEGLGQPSLKWACHPLLPSSVLGFGITSLYIYNCSDLSESKSLPYFQGRDLDTENLATTLLRAGEEPPQNPAEAIGRLITSFDGKEFLLELPSPSRDEPFRISYLIFTIPVTFISESASSGINLPYLQIPENVAARILQPLAVLSNRRLLFLDSERWICTWCFDTAESSGSHERIADIDGTGVEQHYALPSDWAIAAEARSCTATSDGTTLIPVDSDVVAVTYNKLRSSRNRLV